MLARDVALLPVLALVGCACGADSTAVTAPPAAATAPDAHVEPPAAEGSLGISLTTDGSAVLASWIEPSGVDAYRVRVASFDVAAGRWGDASTVVEGSDLLASSVELPTAVRSASGRLFVTFLRRGSGAEASSVHLATFSDGTAWRLLGPVHDDATDTEHGHVSLLAEGDGARAVWLDGRAWVDSGPMAIRSALFDEGGHRVTDDVLDDRVCDCCQTAAAATADGPLVVYRDRTDDERRDLALVRRVGDRWTEPAELASDGWTIRGCPVNGPQVAADDRRVVVAWYTEGSGTARLRVAFSADAGAGFDAPIELDGGRPLGRVDVEWMSDGSALVAWLGADDGAGARVLVRRVGADRRVGATLEVASLGGASAFGAARLARIGDDMMLAWSEPGPPRRVRATIVRATDVAPLAGSPVPNAGPPPPGAVGTVPADFTLPALAGGETSLRSYRGRPLVLAFFARWCAPCIEEIPILAATAHEHADAVAVVGVSVDETDADGVTELAREHGITYPVLLDPGGTLAGGALGVPPLPATFVFDGDGRIVFAQRGGDAELEVALREALAAALHAPEDAHEHVH